MADVSAHAPIFSRGSTVLDYWLAHAEGLTVQPLGARVEKVVVVAPVGHAEALIVRSRMTRRRKAIPAASIAAVKPSTGQLLLDAPEPGTRVRIPRPSPERIAAARLNAARGGRAVRTQAFGAAHATRAGTLSALAWLRPRAVQAGLTTARYGQLAAAQTRRGIAWLTPRVVAGARIAGVTAARLTLAGSVVAARGASRAGRELEHAATGAAERARASIEARRARQRIDLDD